MQAKLTLRLEDSLILRAKEHARRSGRSVSQLVADLFAGLEGSTEGEEDEESLPPIVQSLKGCLGGSGVDEEAYRRYLEERCL
jgi:hypothetical protein